MDNEQTYTAFVGQTLVASGSLDSVLAAIKSHFDENPTTLFVIFEDQTGKQVDFDLRGSLPEVLARALPPRPSVRPGRPKLGVVSREVSLLPQHWEWLEEQPSGASAALRRLVEQARKSEHGAQRARRATDAVNRFLTAMAGNLPGYEEATRSLYRRERERFDELMRDWPADIRAHAQRLARDAF